MTSNAGGIRSSRRGDVAIERRRGDAEAMCDLRHADIGIGQQRLGGFDVVIGEFWRAASGATKPTGGGKARLGAFPDQTALEFRKRAKHVKNQPTLSGRRVERFGQTAKPNAPHPQVFDGFDQLLHRPRQTVELPHDQGVAAARESEGGIPVCGNS